MIIPRREYILLRFVHITENVIGQLKSYTTNKFGNVLWQRSYHDRIIRGEKDYQKIWKYIDTNVIRWKKDCFYNSKTEK